MTGTMPPDALAGQIADAVCALPSASERQLVAIAGPPGAGKSTVAQLAQQELNRRGIPAGLLSMDGFHYDNAILKDRDLLHRKGSPDTFDIAGFRALLERLRTEDEVAVPEFDRDLDKSIAARSVIRADQRVVLVEGNYLFLKAPGWENLQTLWTLKIFLDVDLPTLEQRLTDRWVQHGLDEGEAQNRAMTNDIPNAKLIFSNLLPCDVTL